MTGRVPYRSERRGQGRRIFPVSAATYLDTASQKPWPPIEDINYSLAGVPLSDVFRGAKVRNAALLGQRFAEDSELIVAALDDVYCVACIHLRVIWHEDHATVNPAQNVLFPCFHKSLLSLCTSHDLTMAGLWGPARPHLRHVFESLMIAKFSSTDPLSDVFDRWVDGVELYFANVVLKKIRHPALDETRTLWTVLSSWSHATVYAMQPTLELTEADLEVGENLAITGVFIQWAYHLLSTHIITRSVRYYAARYLGSQDSEASRRLRSTFKRQNAGLSHSARRLIRDFRTTWEV